MSPASIDLGDQLFCTTTEWRGEKQIHLRYFKNKHPTLKGVHMTLLTWKSLLTEWNEIEESIGRKDKQFHLGDNVFAETSEDFSNLDIRRYFYIDSSHFHATKKGVKIRKHQLEKLKLSFNVMYDVYPELKCMKTCKQTHDTELKEQLCHQCNPKMAYLQRQSEKEAVSASASASVSDTSPDQ